VPARAELRGKALVDLDPLCKIGALMPMASRQAVEKGAMARHRRSLVQGGAAQVRPGSGRALPSGTSTGTPSASARLT
jgi:hypothetical protein